MPVTDRTLYLLGKKIGATNVSVFAANGDLIGVLDVIVEADVGDLRRKIDLRSEKGGIRVSSENGQVVLSRIAHDAVAAERAVALAKAMSPNAYRGQCHDGCTVAAGDAESPLPRSHPSSKERDLGVNWFVGGGNLSGAATGLGTVASRSFKRFAVVPDRGNDTRKRRGAPFWRGPGQSRQQRHQSRCSGERARNQGSGPPPGRARSGRSIGRQGEFSGWRRVSGADHRRNVGRLHHAVDPVQAVSINSEPFRQAISRRVRFGRSFASASF